MFTDLFLYGLMVPVLPFLLPERLHTPPSEIQSQTSTLLAAYAFSQALLSIPVGIIADRFPTRQGPFLFGLLSLIGSTVLLFLGQTFWMLMLARCLQGLAAAIVWTVGLALVQETVGTARLGVVIGSIFGFISTGELMSPVLGGILYDKAGLKAVFGLAFGLMGLDLVMRLLVIEQKVASKKYGLDFNKSAPPTHDAERTATTAITQIETQEESNTTNEEQPLLTPSLQDPSTITESFLLPHPQKTYSKIYQTAPILHAIFHTRTLAALLLTTTQALLLAVFDATVPLEASRLFGFTSLQSGLLFIPLTLPSLLLGPLTGRMVDRHGTKSAAVLGCMSIIPTLILLRFPHVALQSGSPEQNRQVGFISALFILISVSITLLGSPGLVEASYVTEQIHIQNQELFKEEGGPFAKLYAVNSMAFSAGLTIGPVVGGWLRERIGWGNMLGVVAGYSAVVGLVCWFYLGGGPPSWKRVWGFVRRWGGKESK